MKKILANITILCSFIAASNAALAVGGNCEFVPQAAGNCVSPTGSTGAGEVRDNKYYGGLVWELDGTRGFKPDLIVGYRSLLVKSDNSVNGGDFSLRFRFDDGINFDSTRLVYVGGRRDLMGNAGIGYSNSYKSPLFNLAVQGAYTRLGADYLWASRNELKFYFEANSLAKPEAAGDGGLSCSSGTLTDLTAPSFVLFGDPNTLSLNGKTCYTPPQPV